MFDDIFDGLFNGLTQSWNRSFREKDGYRIYQKDNGFLIVFNTLGIAEEDIKVVHSKASDIGRLSRLSNINGDSTYLHVYGETKIPELNDQTYDVNYELLINNNKDVDSVQFMCKNGLTLVYVKTKEKQAKLESNAKNIQPGDTFEW